ncbi:MAG: serine hydrolase domain-containing protein [Bacillota bacterium]
MSLRKKLALVLVVIILVSLGGVTAYAKVWIPPHSPSTWQQYATPEEAGWDSSLLEAARTQAHELGATSIMVVYRGKVVAAWGDVEKVTPVHSIRKSFLSALYGIHVAQGKIDISKSLADLKIDEKTPLTNEEKQAKVSDLLKARSGIYLPTAAEPAQMKESRPSRGSYAPGTNWFYNNWDFNALGTIFRQETGEDIFASYQEHLAAPLGMEDFSLKDTHYAYDKASLHPSYAFAMSARDLARFGQLYLQNGSWGGQQLISESWIKESLTPYSDFPVCGYGYLWWTWNQPGLKELGAYAATGMYGNSIFVLPKAETVIVTRVDSTVPIKPFMKQIGQSDRDDLLRQIIAAKTGQAKAEPKLIHLSPVRY